MSSPRRSWSGIHVVAALAALLASCGTARKPVKREAPKSERLRIPDASVCVELRPADFLGSGAFQAFVKEVEALPQFEGKRVTPMLADGLGFDPNEVERIIFTGDEHDRGIAAVFGKGPLNKDALVGLFGGAFQAKSGLKPSGAHRGAEMFVATGGDSENGVAFLDAKALVAGDLAPVRSAVENYKDGKAVSFPQRLSAVLARAPKDAQIVVTFAPTGEFVENLAREGQQLPPQVAQQISEVDSLVASIRSGSSDIQISATAAMKTEDGALQMRAKIGAGLGAVKVALAQALAAPGMEPLQAFLDGVKVAADGKDLVLGLTLKPELVKTVPALMPLIMQMVMQGAGGGAPPGGMPPGMPPMPGM